MRKNAQVSVEFIFIFGIIFLIFLTIFGFTINRRMEVRETKYYLEKRAECMKFSSLISSVFAGGDGTIAKIRTKYLITIFNYSLISVEEIENITRENKIAVLASEAGETSQIFYDTITNRLDPDWYKICFSDISGDGCQKWTSGGMEVATWDSIDNDIHDLIETIYNNPNAYQTIYLEDPTIQYNAVYNGKTYLEILQDWVAEGNALILSEHVMCREGGGSYPSTSYRCNPPGWSNDVWDIFDAELHQEGGSFNNDVTVIIEPDLDIFPNLHKDDTFDFEEESYVKEEGEPLTIVATYDSNGEAAIVYWDYGVGIVFYFGDFQVEIEQEEYSGIISEVIEKVYYSITTKPGKERCSLQVKSPYYQVTGNITIKNENDLIIVTNETVY